MVATRTNRTEAIFQDVRELQADTLEMFARGGSGTPPRRPGGRRSTPRTPSSWRGQGGGKPEFSPETPHELRILESLDEAVRENRLVRRY